VALGLSNFAAAIGIGLSGVDARLRVRVAVVFGTFEAAMPLVGLLIGRQAAGPLGDASRYIGGGLLVATGSYTIWQARRAQRPGPELSSRLGALVVAGLALSIDNLVVGFTIGASDVSLALAVPLIAVVSVGLSLVGLELGGRLGTVAERRGGELGGVILVAVGVAIATGAL
jgi:putative Mn2+ efflux pump MntP